MFLIALYYFKSVSRRFVIKKKKWVPRKKFVKHCFTVLTCIHPHPHTHTHPHTDTHTHTHTHTHAHAHTQIPNNGS